MEEYLGRSEEYSLDLDDLNPEPALWRPPAWSIPPSTDVFDIDAEQAINLSTAGIHHQHQAENPQGIRWATVSRPSRRRMASVGFDKEPMDPDEAAERVEHEDANYILEAMYGRPAAM